MTVVGLTYHHTGKERTKSKGKSEQLRRFESDTNGRRYHGNREQLSRIRCGNAFKQPPQKARPNQQHEQNESYKFRQDNAERQQQFFATMIVPRRIRAGRLST